MSVAQGTTPDPTECYLCGAAFSTANPRSRSHVIARRWFGTPPPPDLPTLPACSGCNNGLSPSEERLRNALVRMDSHDSTAHQQVVEKAMRAVGRNRRPPKEVPGGYTKTHGGVLAPSVLIDLPTADVEPVFRNITRGLYYKRTGQLLPQHVPVRSLMLQERHVGELSRYVIGKAGGVATYGGQFSYAMVIDADDPYTSIWLYLVFNAGVVASSTGKLSALQWPPATAALGRPRKQ